MNEPGATGRILKVLEEQGRHLFLVLKRVTVSDEVAEDLLQELFLRLRDSSEFERAANPAAYATRSALFLAFDWRRRQKRKSVPFPAEPVDGSRAAWERLADQEEVDLVLDALAELTGRRRAIIAWRFLEEKSYAEIGLRLGKSPHQARALCHKAVRSLRQRVQSMIEDPLQSRSEVE